MEANLEFSHLIKRGVSAIILLYVRGPPLVVKLGEFPTTRTLPCIIFGRIAVGK